MLAETIAMPFDPEIIKRSSRGAMQKTAQTTHTGEERWTNMDQNCFEVISSGCAIVGFFVGYGVALGKVVGDLCPSRQDDAEVTIDWNLMPPLCRPDNIDTKNTELEEKRQKKEAGPSSAQDSGDGDEFDPCNPYGADYSA